jgi:hypothetical protein
MNASERLTLVEKTLNEPGDDEEVAAKLRAILFEGLNVNRVHVTVEMDETFNMNISCGIESWKITARDLQLLTEKQKYFVMNRQGFVPMRKVERN